MQYYIIQIIIYLKLCLNTHNFKRVNILYLYNGNKIYANGVNSMLISLDNYSMLISLDNFLRFKECKFAMQLLQLTTN